MSWQLITIFSSLFAFCLAAWAIIYYLTYAVRSQVLGETIWRGNGADNCVALTFDDGHSLDTLDILDFLRKENIKATFFLIGREVEKYPEITRRIVEEGHEIGNHSYSHPIYLFCTPKRTRRELRQTQEIIKKTVGFEPKMARPPCGVRTPAYFTAAKDLGLQTIQWSDAGFDWEKISAAQIAEKVLKNIGENSIILLHDGDDKLRSDRSETVKSLPLIVAGLRAKNLRVAPLSQLNGAAQIESANFQKKFNSA